jgi:lipopolysaccharide cholinephosphotransferase
MPSIAGHHGLAVTVIPLKYLQNKREKTMTKYSNYKTKRVCSTVSRYGYKKQIMDRQIYGSPVMVKFRDGEFFAPQKYTDYLTQIYGDYMKIPPEEKRVKPVDVYRL